MQNNRSWTELLWIWVLVLLFPALWWKKSSSCVMFSHLPHFISCLCVFSCFCNCWLVSPVPHYPSLPCVFKSVLFRHSLPVCLCTLYIKCSCPFSGFQWFWTIALFFLDCACWTFGFLPSLCWISFCVWSSFSSFTLTCLTIRHHKPFIHCCWPVCDKSFELHQLCLRSLHLGPTTCFPVACVQGPTRTG